MAERLSLIPRYTASEAAPAWRLALEPEYVDRREALADLADVDAMLAAVRAGASARNRQIERCRWATFLEDGTLRVTLRLYVWPSDPNIPYYLSAPENVGIGPAIVEARPVSRKFWVSGARLIDLPWMLEEPGIGWVPGLSCFDAWSREIEPPHVRYVAAGARVGIRGEVRGLLSVSGLAKGLAHDLSIHYDKYEPTDGLDSLRPRINKIEADDIDVTCVWTDEAGTARTETATMVIPACVKALLAECGTTYVYRIRPVTPKTTVVYYNTCDGKVLAVRSEARGGGNGR